MATDLIKINKFEVCKKFNLAKYICELPPERRQCDGICIKAPGNILSSGMEATAKQRVGA